MYIHRCENRYLDISVYVYIYIDVFISTYIYIYRLCIVPELNRFDASQRGDIDLNITVLKIIAAISWGWIRKPQLVVQLSVFFSGGNILPSLKLT